MNWPMAKFSEQGLVGVLRGVDVADLAIALAKAEDGGLAVQQAERPGKG